MTSEETVITAEATATATATISEPNVPIPTVDETPNIDCIEVRELDWNDQKGWEGVARADVILCSDLVCSAATALALASCVAQLLEMGGLVLHVSPAGRPGLAEFKAAMKKHKFNLNQITASQDYYANPLLNQPASVGPPFQLDRGQKYEFLQFTSPKE